MKLEGLYLIADTAQLIEKNIDKYIASLIEAGVSMIQFRDKTNYTDEHEAVQKTHRLAQTIQAQCRIYDIPFIVNDDVSLAITINADGVHLGKDDMDVREARQRLGPDRHIGVSCYASASRALQAQQNGADYVAFGAVFNSTTKPQAEPLGSSTEESLCALEKLSVGINIPICAIGGITPNQAKQVLGCGVQMIAVASGILTADNPCLAVKNYCRAWLR